MKKRIFSIMDVGGKKAGFIVICCALIATLGTGYAFALNAPQASVGTTFVEYETEYSKAAAYEKYQEFGMNYDQATGNLHYRGELVRYFEDWYPVDEASGAYAGTDYFNENGTIDAHGVRDLSRIVYNADGSHDPSGVLVGVEPYSQAEFDAQDVSALKRSANNQAMAISSGEASRSGDAVTSNFILEGDSKEAFKVYAEFGLTYDGDDVFRYLGKTVRRFYDAGGALAFTRTVPNDYDVSVDLTAIRDANGTLTGLVAAGREEFDARTERIEQSQREMEEFAKTHPGVTAYSAVETVGDEAADSASASPSAASGPTYSRAQTNVAVEDGLSIGSAAENVVMQQAIGPSYDSASASSVDPDYVDTSLDAYVGYGVSRDRSGKSWVFNGKPIAFLIDPGHGVYANFSRNNADADFATWVESSGSAFLRVVRTPDGLIGGIVDMSADEAVQAVSDVFAN